MKKIIYTLIAFFIGFLSANAQTTILQEGFDGTFPPTGWVILNNGVGGGTWTKNTNVANVKGGAGSMQYARGLTTADAWAFTPALTLNTNPCTISFWAKTRSATDINKLKLTVGTDSTIVAQTTTLLDSASFASANFVKWTAVYTPTSAGDYRFALNCYSAATGRNLYVDSVVVTQLQSGCSGTTVGGFAVSTSNLVCAANLFTLSVNGATSRVTGLNYQWQSSPDSLNWTNIVGDTNTSVSIQNLSKATYYRRSTTCVSSSSTSYSFSVFVDVNPSFNCICSPNNGTTLHGGTNFTPSIDTVNIVGTTLFDSALLASTAGYILDSTSLPSLQQTVTYTLYTAFSAAAIGSAWFDWNQNGTFDSSEWVKITSNGTGGTVSFTVPANAVLGKTILRIRTKRTNGGGNTALNACTLFNGGETKDYYINVVASIACSGTPTGGTTTATVNPVCANTATTLSVAGSTSGVGGLKYQWQSSSDSISWTNIVGDTSFSLTLPTLTTNTFYRRSITCTGLTSYSAGLKLTVNAPINCVCSPANGTTLHTGATNTPSIDTVTILGTVLNNITTTVPTGGYTLNDTSIMPSLQQTVNYTLQAGFSAAGIGSVWFDWNQNGTFDSSEWVKITSNGTGGTINFTVPANAVLGHTLMRIRTKRVPGGGNTALNACTSFAGGETEDYYLNIIAPIGCTGTPVGGNMQASVNPVCSNAISVLSVANATTGVAGLTYQWQSSTDSINWTNISGATSQYDTVKSLTTKTYFRRGITCSGVTSYSDGLLINLNAPINCVCSPTNGTTLHTGPTNTPSIDTVTILGTVLNNITTTVPTGGYTLNDTSIMPSLQQTVTYTLQAGFSTAGIGSVWFDWNQNGTFDSSEWVKITSNGTGGTINFTVPANAVLGHTLMRVRTKRVAGGGNTALNACNSFTGGETEDYYLNIIAPIGCTGTPVGGNMQASVNPVCSNAISVLSVANATTGVAGLTYQWQSSTDSINWTNISGVTSQYDTVKSLTTKTYFRRGITCSGVTSYSDGLLIIVNPSINCVCSPANGTTLHTGPTNTPSIDTVTILGTVLNNITTTVPTGGYTLNDTSIMPSLQQTVTYTLQTGFSAAGIGSVWFDWNQNGTFDSSEWVKITTNGTGGTINFTVPANAVLGHTLMRVRTKRVAGGGNTALNACTSFTGGETEDYYLNIIAPIGCTVTPVGGTTTTAINPICPSTSFTLTVNNATSGVAGLTYQWQSSSDSITWTNIVGATGISYTVTTGITSSSYFRRVTTCSGLNGYANNVYVTLNSALNCICSPTNGTTLHSSTTGPGVDTVMILLGSTTLLNNTSSTIPTGAYTLYITSIMPSLSQAQTYSLNTRLSAAGSISVWFDWNQNGKFDSSEWTRVTANARTGTINFTVPANAPLGNTFMRIRSKGTGPGTNTALNACTTFSNGETEDYYIKVVAGTACSGQPLGGKVVPTANSVCPNISFKLTVTNATTGVVGLTYQWQSSTDSLNWSNIAGATNDTYTDTFGITTKTYFRRTITCSSFSNNSSAIGISMNPSYACYCGPNTGVTLQTGTVITIDSVSIQGTVLNHNSTGAPTNGYSVFSDTTQIPSIKQSLSYTVYVKSSAAPVQTGLWIDWNQNGLFDTSEYKAFTTTGTISTVIITVPTTATLGNTIMRIRDRNIAMANSNACTSFTRGETEDYVIRVVAATPPVVQVSGRISTPNGTNIPNVTVKLTGTSSDSMVTTGSYQFNLNTSGSYTARVAKNNDVKKANGVTTIDIALIQGHILQKNLFNSAYKIIAADVDNNGLVNTIDLVYIKRLILTLDSTFKGNRLWAFVDSSYSFPNYLKPFPYKDSINFSGLSASLNNQTFVGVKLGDVNYDWNSAIARNVNSKKSVEMFYDDVTVANNDLIRIPVKVNNFRDLMGMQFTLNFNKDVMQFKGIEKNTLHVDYATNHINEGFISFLWNDPNNQSNSLNDGSELFELVFEKKGSITLEDINITSDLIPVEAFDNSFNLVNIIKTKGQIIGTKLLVETINPITKENWQVVPNPTEGVVQLSLAVTKSKSVQLILTNFEGKILFEERFGLIAGNNYLNINLQKQNHLTTGVYFLKAIGMEGDNVKKIIIK